MAFWPKLSYCTERATTALGFARVPLLSPMLFAPAIPEPAILSLRCQ